MMTRWIRTLMISEMAAVVSFAALALVSRGTTEEVVCVGMVGMFIGLTAGIIVGACWALGYSKNSNSTKECDNG